MVSRTTSTIHHVGTFLLFLSFIMLLVVSITAPTVHDISMLKVMLRNSSTIRHSSITYGSFGHCVLDIKTPDNSDQDKCSGTSIGYPIASIQQEVDQGASGNGAVTNFSNASRRTLNNLTNVMILHPIACGLAFIAFIFALGAGRFGTVVGSFIAFLTWVVVLVAMVIDFIVFGTVKDHVNDRTNTTGSHAKFGPGMWLMLATFIILFFAIFIVFFSCFARRKETRSSTYKDETTVYTTNTKRRKRFGLF